VYVFAPQLLSNEIWQLNHFPQATRIETREDIVNGKCYCGAPKCIGTLFPRIIRDEESGDEGGNEGVEVGGEGDHTGEKSVGRLDGGDDVDMDI
jgi:hypothetical protein